MRRLFRIPLWGLVAGAVALAADWLPDALSELEFFRAREYRVDGVRLLDEKQVLAIAAISPFVSVFDDLTSIELRLEQHPLIRRAQVTAELPGTLVVTSAQTGAGISELWRAFDVLTADDYVAVLRR